MVTILHGDSNPWWRYGRTEGLLDAQIIDQSINQKSKSLCQYCGKDGILTQPSAIRPVELSSLNVFREHTSGHAVPLLSGKINLLSMKHLYKLHCT